ncbi:MAG: VWA domain-containing protein [Deltaproteobacteria bacterium]|nr:VWA domain-containing protein [Deltaproteobacteria bacterium]
MSRLRARLALLAPCLAALALAGCKVRFGNDWAIWLLAVVPVVIAGYVASFILRRRALGRFAPGRAEALSERASLAKRAVKATLMVLAIGLAVVALTRPQYGGKEKMLRVKGLDIVFALDFSKSMYAQDVKPDRITMLKQEVMAFLDELTGDRVGVIAFAGDAVRFPLTTDYEAVRLFLRDMLPHDMPVGGTNIALAVQGGTELLTSGYTKKKRSKVMILVTDGEDHGGGVVEALRFAREKGVKIFVLGIGTGTPELIPRYLTDGTQDGFMRDSGGSYVTTSLSAEGEEMLGSLASSTGGTYTRSAPGKISLPAVEREIRKLKQSELKARKVTIYEEFYLWFLIPALILLVLETMPGDARSHVAEMWARWRRRREER